jgi:Putative prokaryotic signal transducing protein
MKPADLVVVSTFRSAMEAQVAKGRLEGAGIESMIRTDNAGGMYPAIGQVELLVRSDDLEKANDALARHARP